MEKIRIHIYFILSICLFILNPHTFAATINVPAEQPTIQSGINAAQNGDTVLVDDGTYCGEGNVNIDFIGKTITLKSKNGPDVTIINCEATLETKGFIFQNHETNDTVLDGFTIKNGMHKLGAGIRLSQASPTIKNCIIDGSFFNSGAGIDCYRSDPIITDCIITRNTAGILVRGDVIKEGNSFVSVYSRPTINNCIITENTGVGIGCILDAYATINNCTISKNSGRGVLVQSFAGSNISNSHISQNTGGGLQCLEYSRIKIKNSIIDKNTAKEGAGFYCSPTSNLDVSDCIIVGNTASRHGGGLVSYTRFGNVYVKYCTFTQNSAGNRGGGIYANDRGHLNMTNSIVWDNTSEVSHAEVMVWGSTNSIKSCNIKDGLDGIDREPDGRLFIYEDNIDEDPLFVNADAGDFTLQDNSPAENMGVRKLSDQNETIEEDPFVDQGQTTEEDILTDQDKTKEEDPLAVSHHGKRIVSWANLKRR